MGAMFCTECGLELKPGVKFCTSCGKKIQVPKVSKVNRQPEKKIPESPGAYDTLNQINKKIELENNQTPISKRFYYAAGFFLLVLLLTYWEIIDVHPAFVMLSIFFGVSALVVGYMFRSRSKKLQKLISGESLIASWTLIPKQKDSYVNYLFEKEAGRNKIILFTISVIAVIVFGIFILIIDEGKMAMFGVLVGLIVLLSIFAFGMPYYYKSSNKSGDGEIMIGGKYVYINGYFHNWDFPLSGLSKLKIIEEPFHGINIVYYYTDRTLQHNEELFIPANDDIDLHNLLNEMKKKNS